MNVDDLLAEGVRLPDDAIPLHAVLIVDYTDPGSGERTLTAVSDDALPSWALRGMLIEAYDVVFANHPYEIGSADDDEEDD